MKKAKIMLLAITVMAVVGGSLAFKAKKNPLFCWYTSTTTAIGICPLVETLTLGNVFTAYYTSTPSVPGSDCAPSSTCTTTVGLVSEP